MIFNGEKRKLRQRKIYYVREKKQKEKVKINVIKREGKKVEK